MSSTKQRIRRDIRQVILYGFIGSIAASIDFVVFHILTIYAELNYIVANCFSVLIGIITSFSLNRTLNFKVTDKIVVRFGLFFTSGMFGLLLSNVILWFGIDKCNFSETVTKVVSIFIVAFVQFVFNKFITFKQTK